MRVARVELVIVLFEQRRDPMAVLAAFNQRGGDRQLGLRVGRPSKAGAIRVDGRQAFGHGGVRLVNRGTRPEERERNVCGRAWVARA